MSIGSFFKAIIPVKMKATIKMGNERQSFKALIKTIEQDNEDFDYLIGTPIHTNLGDHLITMSEYKLFKDLGYQKKVYEIPTEVYQVYSKRLKGAIKANSKVFINGGGWMGNLWVNEELLLQNIVDTFHNNTVIIFPQTIFYDKDKTPYKELIESGNNVFSKCKDLSLFVRDQQSYDFANEKLEISKIYLVPDVALMYSADIKKTKKSKKTIGLCLRDDRELSRNEEALSELINRFTIAGYEMKKISTMSDTRVPTYQRESIVKQRLQDFADCDAVIADRLHGMIFSVLAKTPCIALDNRTKKVSGVYDKWLNSNQYVLPQFDRIDINECKEFVNCGLIESKHDSDTENSYLSVFQEVING